MARPELVGAAKLESGASVRSLGLDLVIPGEVAVSNLIVVTGWKQGTGSIGSVLPYADGKASTLSGASTSAVGSDNIRMTIAQFRNLTVGVRRVSVISSSTGTFDAIFLLAFLLKDAGLATVGANFTYPVSTPAITITDRFMHVYWAYEASEIADSDLPTVLRVSDLGKSLS